MTIGSPASLRAHLQTAIEIERATLPPYLCALYSLEEGSNAEAGAVIESVVLDAACPACHRPMNGSAMSRACAAASISGSALRD
jgi:hypothetical protein